MDETSSQRARLWSDGNCKIIPMSQRPPSHNLMQSATIFVPTPPPDSCFILDRDSRGRPRLRWRLASGGRSRWLAVAALAFWLFLWTALAVFLLGDVLLDVGPATPRDSGPLTWIGGLALWSVAGILVARLLYCFMRPPRPECLIFGTDVLRHDPGSFTYSDWTTPQVETTRFWRSEPMLTIARAAITGVRLETTSNRQRLVVDIQSGARQIEIGRFLSGRDRWWLAEALRAWVSPRSTMAIPPETPSTPPQQYRFSDN